MNRIRFRTIQLPSPPCHQHYPTHDYANDPNDDANDPELKINAQLSQVRLPADGIYTIEASRFDGAGSYTITIVSTG